MAGSKRAKASLMKVRKRGSEYADLNIKGKLKSSPIISWQIEWETVEAVTDFLFLGSKNTAAGDCSVKSVVPLGRKAMANLNSVDKQRHHPADKSPYSRGHGFPVVMYGCRQNP